jgi:hypothetical protein
MHKGTIPKLQILDYEIYSSRWAHYLCNPFLQTLAGKYYAWKTTRKWNRYAKGVKLYNRIKTKRENEQN